MAVIGVIGSVFSLVVSTRGMREHDHASEHEHGGSDSVTRRSHAAKRLPSRAVRAATGIWGAVLVLAVVFGVLVVSPTTLSAEAASNRTIDVQSTATTKTAPTLVGVDTVNFTVLDWESLISKGATVESLADKTVDVSGFVTSAPSDPNLMVVNRYLITCCALDAQPVGVSLYLPDWASQYAVGDWLEVTGGFVTEPGKSTIVVKPQSITRIDTPADPYVY